MYGWFDLNHFSWAGPDKSGLPVISWPFSIVEALPGGTSSQSISLRLSPNGRLVLGILLNYHVRIYSLAAMMSLFYTFVKNRAQLFKTSLAYNVIVKTSTY